MLGKCSCILLTLCTSGVLGSGCAAGQERGTETIDEAGPIERIEVDLDAGHVDITSAGVGEGARGVVDSRWSEGAPEVLHYVQDGVLYILGRCGSLELTCRTDVTLDVSPDTSIGVSTQRGEITVRGVTGDVEGAVDDGNIALQNIGGVVFVETGTGNITADGLRGTIIDARTERGTVEMRVYSRPLRLVARTESGDVNLTVPTGAYRIQTEAPSGDLILGQQIEQDATSTSVIVARTRNGDIRIEGGQQRDGQQPPMPPMPPMPPVPDSDR